MTTTTHWEIEGKDIELSRSDKLLYPKDGYHKEDVAGYFHSVAPVMLPHMRGKPLTLRRFPNGIGSQGFFQKEASGHFPDWVRVHPVPQRTHEGSVRHVICDDAASLVYLANQACLEFHISLSTVDNLDRPVVMVFDLDPPQGQDLSELRSVVRSLCDQFREQGLVPHIQATGGKGFHIVAPLTGKKGFDEVRAAARELAEAAVAAAPDRLTVEQRKANRGDRIFVDTNRNAYGQTMIAPYSLRARTGAPAATPLELSELSRTTPQGYRLANMSRRLAKKTDPWAGMDARSATFG